MLSSLKGRVTENLLNAKGWRTNRKILVIESDDWGSIRMHSNKAHDSLVKAGVQVDKCPYNKYDALESERDLSSLFEVLSSVKDKYGRSAVFTPNMIMANPDFEKIRNSGFKEYHFEPFTETYKRYPEHQRSFELINQGIDEGIFYPQLHGREHMNVHLWMKVLKSGSKETLAAFDHEVFGISSSITREKRPNFMPALDYQTEQEKEEKPAIIEEGANMFDDIFGYRSESFIAPSYTWSRDFEPAFLKFGIRYFQGVPIQKERIIGEKKFKTRMHYLGQKNPGGQYYLVRNCYFEPTLLGRKNTVEDCIRRIGIAFKWKKPAIMGAHRVNFMGFLHEENRTINLKMFAEILKTVEKNWPDVEFMSTAQLGDLISGENN